MSANGNNVEVGVMQGRLLPKYQGRYQAHPVGYWQEEFSIANTFGLSCIEFIVDYNDLSRNPLAQEKGLEEIETVCRESGVQVRSICADYFMEAPLHSSNSTTRDKSRAQLEQLIKNAARLGVTDIVIPCVDQASLLEKQSQRGLIDALRRLQLVLESAELNLALETDLGPQEFQRLLEEIGLPQVTVNYDIGNSAALGYDTEEELSVYGSRITDVHIKDRTKGGGSVELGTGDADIEKSLSLLLDINYSGFFIMQAFRDDEGLAIFERQLKLFRKMLKSAGY
jgi:L-ribulose-5-phosphate 3-epimerase